jgi:hypothetical protein
VVCLLLPTVSLPWKQRSCWLSLLLLLPLLLLQV